MDLNTDSTMVKGHTWFHEQNNHAGVHDHPMAPMHNHGLMCVGYKLIRQDRHECLVDTQPSVPGIDSATPHPIQGQHVKPRQTSVIAKGPTG
jgi:hypothetical protein